MRFNFEVIESIFTTIHLKVSLNVVNISEESLSFDSFKKEIKIYILNSVLDEMKSFIISDVYYKSHNSNFNFEPDKFFELILLRVKKSIQKEFGLLQNTEIASLECDWVVNYLETEDGELLDLALYLIHLNLGDQSLPTITGFDRIKLITALLENLIIKLSNVFVYITLLHFEVKQMLYEGGGFVNRDFLKLKKNNFYWQAYVTSTFLKPKYIYYNLYLLKILSKYGICTKVMYMPNSDRKEKYRFSKIQFAVLCYFELIDFIHPKILRIIHTSKDMWK